MSTAANANPPFRSAKRSNFLVIGPGVSATRAETFRSSRSDDILLDANNVQQVGAQCVQVLRAASDFLRGDAGDWPER
jgi:anti-anti-sigma regulatory factor